MNTVQGALELIINIFKRLSQESSEKAWWICIKTEKPEYTYYFGPFNDLKYAEAQLPGFIEDLRSEDAAVTHASVLWCNPPEITIEGTHVPV